MDRRPLALRVRLVSRAMSDRPPQRIWADVADPRQWDRMLHDPARRTVRRVKLVDAPRPDVGAVVQVLYDDLSWTRYRIVAWQPAKRLEILATDEGKGEAEGRGPAVPWSERLILIPQGAGAELEWSVRFHPRGLGRLVAPLAVPKEAWQEALDQRGRATR